MITEITKWNTGNMYSVQGQRIVAARLRDGNIAFSDIDRSIDGIIDDASGECDIKSVVTSCYVQGHDYRALPWGEERKELAAAAENFREASLIVEADDLSENMEESAKEEVESGSEFKEELAEILKTVGELL